MIQLDTEKLELIFNHDGTDCTCRLFIDPESGIIHLESKKEKDERVVSIFSLKDQRTFWMFQFSEKKYIKDFENSRRNYNTVAWSEKEKSIDFLIKKILSNARTISADINIIRLEHELQQALCEHSSSI